MKLVHVDNDGIVTLQHHFDRETQSNHVIEVLVSDKGAPPHILTATLSISVTDINDNPPYIKAISASKESSSRASSKQNNTSKFDEIIIEENSTAKEVARLTLDDPDDWKLGHGPPFKLSLARSASSDIRQSLAVDFNSGNSFN